jgi:hypothetical protein
LIDCDEAVINKFVEDLILDQESKSIEEENPKIEENYVMPKGNFMSHKFTGGHGWGSVRLKIVLQIRKC